MEIPFPHSMAILSQRTTAVIHSENIGKHDMGGHSPVGNAQMCSEEYTMQVDQRWW